MPQFQRFIALLLTVLVGTEATGQSVKLPDWNSASEPPVPAAFIFQPIESLSMLGEDGALLLCFEMPKGETKTQNGKYGFVTYLMGSHWHTKLSKQFNLQFNPQGNCFRFVGNGAKAKVELQTEELDRDGELIGETAMLVIVQRSGDTFSIRAVSCRYGRIYTGTPQDAAGYVLSEVRGGEGFAVGTVANTPKSPERDRGKGHQGNIEFVGYATQTISDELAKRIALGADPVMSLRKGTLRWYRHFDGAEGKDRLGPTTPADTTAPSLVIDGKYMRPGAHIRRQSPDKYLTLDYIPDGYIWGLDLAKRESKTVTFTGTHGGLPKGSAIELRVVDATDGNVIVDWTRVAQAGDDGKWEGALDVPRSRGWNCVEIRAADEPGLVFRSRSRCAVGYKIGVIGQSEVSYFLRGYGGGMTYKTGDGAVSFVTLATANPNSNSASHSRPQIFVAEPWDKVSDGVLATARQLRQYTDTPLCFVALAKSGTGATELADDDRNEKRRWEDLEAKVRFAGRDFSMLVWMWHASDRGFGERYGSGIFDPIVLGIKKSAKDDRYDHYICDGTFDSQMVFCPMLHWGFGCQRDVLEGEHRIAAARGTASTMACMRGQKAWAQTNADGNPKAPHFPPVPQDEFPSAGDIQGDKYHSGHSDLGSPLGPRRIGYRMGEYLARVLDLSDSKNPRMQAAWFADDRSEICIRFSLPNGGILRTGGSKTVTDIWVNSKDKDTTWVMSEHTARIVDPRMGIVKLSKTQGQWPQEAKVAYVINLIALENVKGYLYEGPVDGEGTGPLAMEDGLGIPVQSHLPVLYRTSIVTVQKKMPE